MNRAWQYKFEAPSIENAVKRANLLKKPKKDTSLYLVEAPAGYGKTYFAHQLSLELGKPVLWYRIDENDNDPNALVQGFGAAMEYTTKDDGVTLNVPANSHVITAEIIMRHIVNTFKKGLTIVLDDVHFITDHESMEFISYLLKIAGGAKNVCFILTSRESIDLNKDIMVKRGVRRFLHNELLFSVKELDEYLAARGVAHSSDFINDLYKSTNGWIAAVNLLLLFNTKSIVTGLDAFTDYVHKEILGKLDTQTKMFLVDTSLFALLDPAVCNSYLGVSHSEHVLKELAGKYFLLYSIGDGVFKLHDLLRDILEKQIENREEQYQKAAAAYIENGQQINAVEFLLSAKQYENGLMLMKQQVSRVIKSSNWITIKKWLSCFSEEQIMDNALLCILAAELKLYNSSVYEAEKYLYTAEKLYKNANDEEGYARCLNVQARILRSQGRYKESLQKMEDAVAVLAGERFDIPMETALSYLFIGDFQAVEDTLQKAYDKAADTMDNRMIAHIVSCMAHFSYLKGDYAKSVSLYKKSASLSGEVYYSHFQRSCLATIYQDWGMLDKALRLAKDSVEVKERYSLVDTLPYAYYQLAHIYVDLQQFDKAEIYYNKAIDTANEIGGETFFKILSRMLLARCYIKRGQIKKTRETAREAIKEAMEEGGYIEAICCLLMGIIFLQMRKTDRAKEFIARGRGLIETAKPKYFVSMLYGALAFIALKENDEASLVKYGIAYLNIASACNFIGMGISLYSMFSAVIKRLPQEKITFAHRAFIMELDDRCAKKSLVSKFFNTEKHSMQSNYTMLKTLFDKRRRYPFTANMFGTLTITRHEEKINLKGKISIKAKEMLEFLLHRGRAVTKDEIIDTLWPDSSSKNLDDLFHATLYSLRKGLKKIDGTYDYVVYENGMYNMQKDVFFCVHNLYSAMLTILTAAKKLTEKEVALIDDILKYYDREYLYDVDREWAGKSRAYYETLFEKAATRVSRYYIENDEPLKASGLLYRLIEVNDYSEEGYYLLMKALLADGQQSTATHIYENYARILKDELGLSPAERMSALLVNA